MLVLSGFVGAIIGAIMVAVIACIMINKDE